jgi:hypothetical protein
MMDDDMRCVVAAFRTDAELNTPFKPLNKRERLTRHWIQAALANIFRQ